jgi:ankyrin repeat protein
MLDFLHLLAANGPLDLEIVDTRGWTVLHRVASWGTAAEVDALLELGASPRTYALPLRWNALHHAAFYGNYATLLALLPACAASSIHEPDERGWTLLHIAASAGHDEIVRHLLQLGADPSCRSRPFMSHMPEMLFGKRCTPADAAAAQSPERLQKYLAALQELGLETDTAREKVRLIEDEEFWDAAEDLVSHRATIDKQEV